MPDLTQEFLPALLSHRLPEIWLGDGFVYPQYSGRSLLNVPDSLCRLLGVPEIGVGAFDPGLLARLDLAPGSARRVMLILVDALSLSRLRRWISAGAAPALQDLIERGHLIPLTSITPSTTSAAMCSLWTGRSPAEHGWVGYELWLKEYGMVVNSILQTPISFQGDPGALQRAGFIPETYLPFPTLGAHLEAHGVPVTALMPYSILKSGLTRMVMHQVKLRGYSSVSDLWGNARRLLEDSREEREYLYVYWNAIDTFSHQYGPDDERTLAEFSAFCRAFQEQFLDKLPERARRDTLLLLTADHGAASTYPDPYYDLGGHPNLLRRLHLLPTGEQRLAYLFIRPGQTEAVRETIERTWPNQFALLDPRHAQAAGLFGPGNPHPTLFDRVGDLIAVAKGSAYWWWGSKENRLYGRHGGLSADEMLIPLIAARPG